MTTESVKIIDNFLELSIFEELQNTFCGPYIPWYYNKGINKPTIQEDLNLNDYQFTHKMFENNIIYTELFPLIQPILNKLEVKSLIRIKANLSTKTEIKQVYGLHKDTDFECTTAIFYMNTNNGYTILGDEKIEAVENRLVKFNSQIPHTGSSASDTQIRVVLNFNYF